MQPGRCSQRESDLKGPDPTRRAKGVASARALLGRDFILFVSVGVLGIRVGVGELLLRDQFLAMKKAVSAASGPAIHSTTKETTKSARRTRTSCHGYVWSALAPRRIAWHGSRKPPV